MVLAGVTGAFVVVDAAPAGPAPTAQFTAALNATDGYPDGQTLRITHEAGETLDVAAVTLVVRVERVDAHARLSGFPTRRLTGEEIRGDDRFDNSYAGVDGVIDAATTDGYWSSGEVAELRFAQGDVDVRPGDRVRVQVVHDPTTAVLADRTVVAE